MKNHITSALLALGLFLLCGIAGAVEADAKINPMAKEVALQSWYNEPQKARGVYCDMPKKKVARILKNKYNQKGKAIKKAYIYILKGC